MRYEHHNENIKILAIVKWSDILASEHISENVINNNFPQSFHMMFNNRGDIYCLILKS